MHTQVQIWRLEIAIDEKGRRFRSFECPGGIVDLVIVALYMFGVFPWLE